MTCPKCGSENSDAVSRCLKCGSSLVVSVEAETWVGGAKASAGDETWAGSPKSPSAPHPARDETWAGPPGGAPQGPADAQTWAGQPSSRPDAPTAAPFSRSAHANAPTAVGFGFGATAAAQGQIDFGPRYQVEKLLGQGGMGAVYKAYDRDLDRTVALKLIRPELTVHPESMMRFKQELLLASKISHKNILRIHDLGDAGGMKFISMAYIEGHDLSDLLRNTGRLPVPRVLQIARQLCAALEAAHNEGVVHRDFKPQNIMLDQSDNVYVSDFGLAKSLGEEGGMTMTGELLGTPRYMAPEQVEGKKVDARTDLYALGLVIYEMVTGDVPFQNETTLTMMYKRANEVPPSPKIANPEVPDWLVRIIMKCLERDPDSRYHSAHEIFDDINANRAPSVAPGMSISIPRMRVTVSKRRGAVVVIAALVLIAAVATPLIIRYRHRQTAGETTAAKAKYVAVLPLKVVGDQASLDYIANGVVEAVTAKLFQLKEVRVASSSALEKLGKNAESVSEIGKALGVNMVVSGTLQGSGDKLRIVMNMNDAASGERLWTQEFSGVTGDLLTLEDQIYNKVTSALELKLSHEELARTSAHPTENIGAYQLYLQGRNAMRGKLDAKAAQVAIDYFDKARQQDPEFALAYAGIA
ncbi:MAG TPA: protein kinase, partial [Terriglobales bacterium]|nr:protein kinase [Terriglobales bacterium]